MVWEYNRSEAGGANLHLAHKAIEQDAGTVDKLAEELSGRPEAYPQGSEVNAAGENGSLIDLTGPSSL